MKRVELKKQACLLRGEGKTYSEIKGILNVNLPKSTLSYWCKGVVLRQDYYDKVRFFNQVNLAKFRELALQVNRTKQQILLENIYKHNKYLLNKIDEDVEKIILAILYLGEGTKWKSSRYLGLGNSNSEVIKLYLKLLRNCYKINENKLKCRISYRADQDIKELQNFWSNITKIPLNNFYKTKFDPRTIGKITKNKEYKGVCVVYYCDTKIQLELEIIADLIMKGARSIEVTRIHGMD